jgi:lipopolysaccharide transport system ATP-binding protein
MEGDVVIQAEGLGKKYLIGHQAERERYVALRDVLARTAQHAWRKTLDMARGRAIVSGDTTEEFWALKDVSFEVKRGEVVGVIGRNGAGKSTLLKILSRITEPTEGRVTITGRVGSLLEVGTGFHPELTGRENIYLNGAILGMTRAEIKQKFDEIVAFAEVERFLDTPVKRYSSGMYVRLAFAVAAHLEPEILVVDEVLAVGDAEFQKKCLGKMNEVAGHGRTVLFVSHNMAAVQTLCPRSIYLASGSLVAHGPTDSLVRAYLDNRQVSAPKAQRHAIRIQDGFSLENVQISGSGISVGDPFEVALLFNAERAGRIVECAILIHAADGVRVSVLDLRESAAIPVRYTEGRMEVRARVDSLPFVEGTYIIGLVLVTDEYSGELNDLEEFYVGAARSSKHHAPYPAESRGLVTLQTKTTVSFGRDAGTSENQQHRHATSN